MSNNDEEQSQLISSMTETTGEPDDKIMSKRGTALKVKTKLQNQLIWMILAAMAIPTVVLGGSMYFMVARLSAPNTSVSPHEVIVGIMGYVAVLFPLSITALLYWAFHGTNKLVGPIERITQELNQRIEGQKSGPIVLRPGDHLIPLVDKINGLLEERENFKTVKNLDQPAVNPTSVPVQRKGAERIAATLGISTRIEGMPEAIEETKLGKS